MFTADDYFNITNARILNENVNQTWQNVKTATSTTRTNTTPIRLTGSNTALRPADLSPEDPEKEARRKKRGNLSFEVRENFDIVTEFLFVEGYTDTIESAELMAENISETWVNEILDEKFVGAMDTTGRGPDHRTRFRKFKGRRERKFVRRQGTGGFQA